MQSRQVSYEAIIEPVLKMKGNKLSHLFTRVILKAMSFGMLISAEILRLPACNKYFAEFTIIHGQRELFNTFTTTIATTNRWHCSALCTQYERCKSITVAKNGSMCKLHHDRNGENGAFLKPSKGWTFMETDMNSLNVSLFYL